jgi:hypothetical protein
MALQCTMLWLSFMAWQEVSMSMKVNNEEYVVERGLNVKVARQDANTRCFM